MPLGQRAVSWSRRALAGRAGAGRVLLLAGLVLLALPAYLVAGLWFDLLYVVLGWVAGRRLTPRVRGVIAGVTVVVLLAVIASAPPRPTAAPGSTAPALAAAHASPSVATVAPTPSVSPPPAETATPVPLDPDDGESGPAPTAVPSPAATTNPHAAAVGWLPGEPNPGLTPGAFNPAVTQATIGSTICVSGWTATVRPSSSYTSALKVQQIAEYGYTDTSTADYEEDHLIPLELGGAPKDPANLWPEPYAAALADGRDTGARVKDTFENSLKRQVCAGEISLATARAAIGDHWVHYFYGIPLSTTAPTPGATPMPVPTATAPTTALGVRITGVKNPVLRGTPASVTAATSAGAVCTIKVTLPSGRVSTVAALQQSRTASSSGVVNWTWTVTSNTGTGTANVRVTCTLGGSSGAASATFSITS